MAYEFNLLQNLTKKEQAWVAQNINYNNLGEILKKMVEIGAGRQKACANKNRIEKVRQLLMMYDNPPEILEDRIEMENRDA